MTHLDDAVAPPGRAITVYLLERHEAIRRGLRLVLEEQHDVTVVGESGLAGEALAEIPGLAPDVAILGCRLPDATTVDVCRAVRAIDPAPAVLVLTSLDDEVAIYPAIAAGAAGYVLKQARGNDVAAAVRRVAADRSLLDPAITSRVLELLRAGHASAEPA